MEPAGGVALLAVQLEHSLQPWLVNSADARVAQVLADQQTEGAISFHSPRWQAGEALHASMLEITRQQHETATDVRRESFHRKAQLIHEGQFLETGAGQQRSQLVAHRCKRQRIKGHSRMMNNAFSALETLYAYWRFSSPC